MPRPRTVTALALLLTLLVAPSAGAQLVYTLDAGGTTASWDDGPRSTGFALSPTVRLELPRSAVLAMGGVSLFGGGWTAHGVLTASTFSRPVRGVRMEWAGTARGVGDADRQLSAYLTTQGRLHLASATAGVWAGGGIGRTVSRSAASGLATADAGAWWHGRSLTLSASLSRSWFRSPDNSASGPAQGGWSAAPLLPPLLPEGQLTYRRRVLDDVTGGLQWEIGPLDLGATAGARLPTYTDPARHWGEVTATLWLTRTLGVVAAGGSYPETYLQGFSGARYLTLGVRVASTPRARAELPPPRVPGATSPSLPANRLVIVQRADSTTRTIRLITPGAAHVELMADFTDWRPVPLEAIAPDVWQLPTPVPPGTYRVSVRLDHGPWTAPPGVPVRRDEFGGEGGVVVVQ